MAEMEMIMYPVVEDALKASGLQPSEVWSRFHWNGSCLILVVLCCVCHADHLRARQLIKHALARAEQYPQEAANQCCPALAGNHVLPCQMRAWCCRHSLQGRAYHINAPSAGIALFV